MEEEYEFVEFREGDLTLAVRVSVFERTAWLSKEDMSVLFGRDRSVISKHIKKLLAEGALNEESNVHVLHVSNSTKPVPFYNLDVVIAVGQKTKSKNGILLKDFIDEFFRQQANKNADNIVIFENGNVSLPVQVSPVENTVWISKEGLISLFGTSRQNVEYHIPNIYGQNELEEGATCKEILQVQNEAGRRTTKLYNLDLIILLEKLSRSAKPF